MSFTVTNPAPAPIRCKRCELAQRCRRCGNTVRDFTWTIPPAPPPRIKIGPTPPKTLKQARKDAIQAALTYTNGDILKAARLLGTGKTSLYTWRRKFPNWFQNGTLDAK